VGSDVQEQAKEPTRLMPPITFDTSVLKSYKPVDFPAGFVFSAVVIQEMMASAADAFELKRWAAAWGAYEREALP
jgi:hypothetical protein